MHGQSTQIVTGYWSGVEKEDSYLNKIQNFLTIIEKTANKHIGKSHFFRNKHCWSPCLHPGNIQPMQKKRTQTVILGANITLVESSHGTQYFLLFILIPLSLANDTTTTTKTLVEHPQKKSSKVVLGLLGSWPALSVRGDSFIICEMVPATTTGEPLSSTHVPQDIQDNQRGTYARLMVCGLSRGS